MVSIWVKSLVLERRESQRLLPRLKCILSTNIWARVSIVYLRCIENRKPTTTKGQVGIHFLILEFMWQYVFWKLPEYGHLHRHLREQSTLSYPMISHFLHVWSENSGFGCSRNVLWPAELGSSSFSPVRTGRHPDEWVGRARMQISKTHCAQKITHCNI